MQLLEKELAVGENAKLKSNMNLQKRETGTLSIGSQNTLVTI